MSISYLTTYRLSEPCHKCGEPVVAGQAVTVTLLGLHAYPPDPEEALLDDYGRELGMLDIDFTDVVVEHADCKADPPYDDDTLSTAVNAILNVPSLKGVLSREYFELKLKKVHTAEEVETLRVVQECEDYHSDGTTAQERFRSEVETYTLLLISQLIVELEK